MGDRFITIDDSGTVKFLTVDDSGTTKFIMIGDVYEQWLKCSDNSFAASYDLDDSHYPTDDYAWIFVSGSYIKCYKSSGLTTTASTNPCSVSDPTGTPTACSDIVIDWFTDTFNDNSLNDCKWTDNSSGGSISETNQRIECSANASGTNRGRASSRVTQCNYSGDFTITDTITPVSFGPVASGELVAAVFVGCGASFEVRIYRTPTVYDVRYWDGSDFIKAFDYSSPINVEIARVGTTVTTKINGTTYDTRTGSGNLSTVNLNGEVYSANVGCTVAHDGFTVAE